MKKTIAINEKYGVFIGTVAGYAIFSKNDPVGSYKAYGFKNEVEAKLYFDENLSKSKKGTFFVSIDSDTDYVSCVDIIKAGYGEHAADMINNMHMPSEAIN
jgi:hypothetical protein